MHRRKAGKNLSRKKSDKQKKNTAFLSYSWLLQMVQHKVCDAVKESGNNKKRVADTSGAITNSCQNIQNAILIMINCIKQDAKHKQKEREQGIVAKRIDTHGRL